MRNRLVPLVAALLLPVCASAQVPPDSLLPVRGLAIAAPDSAHVDAFVAFIDDVLVPRGVNTLVLRVDYGYAYESHPELRGEAPLSRAQVGALVAAARRGGIRLIPQINLLGHQSWASRLGNLLRVYPEFDETPHVEMPETYSWPNDDGLYCKSYCPLHPEVHDVVFALVDELVEAFEADAFHAGMDEVFYLGDDRCPRCRGRDKAELFAGEVRRIRDHLADRGVELWIWGDRLLDGRTTGLGMWEASMNNTHRAVDLIPKDVVINDWHYTTATPTAAYFAAKGFRVVTCPWRLPDVAARQLEMTLLFREDATPEMRDRFAGMMHTVWSGAATFMDQYYGRVPSENERGGDQAATFRRLFDEIDAAAQRAEGEADRGRAAGPALAMDDLYAWCIVPYDSVERTPEERIAMLRRLGFARYAYDWRTRHLPEMARELRLARDRGVGIQAVWFWVDARDRPGRLNADGERVLAALEEAGVATQLWVGFSADYFDGLDDDEALARAVDMVRYLSDRAAETGSRVALYNHGGWFGRPENQVRIIEALPGRDVGIVYNFHHAHDQLGRFDALVDLMLPHLWAVNLNGMRPDGPKILPFGAGTHERRMLQRLLDAGFTGPFGVLGHVEDADVEDVLRRNLRGLGLSGE